MGHATMSTKIFTRFLILSDTHGFDIQKNIGFPLSLPLPKVDVVLHCGDLTQVGGLPEYRKAIRMLGSIDAELKLVIAGNHDLELDPNYDPDEPDEHEKALSLWTGPEAIQAGITYLTEGSRSFTLNNGSKFTIYASPFQPEFGDWAFGYRHSEDRFNIEAAAGCTSIAEYPVPEGVDIMMTHGPPYGILDQVGDGRPLGCKNLLRAVRRAEPLVHCFGHIHEGYGVHYERWKDGSKSTRRDDAPNVVVSAVNTDLACQISQTFSLDDGTLMVNAALQTSPSQWRNAPWLVELQLPRA